jgi:hypothetical protein
MRDGWKVGGLGWWVGLGGLKKWRKAEKACVVIGL